MDKVDRSIEGIASGTPATIEGSGCREHHEPRQLVLYEAARRALAEANRVDEVKGIRDQAEAMRAYARQASDHLLQNMASEIRLRAERRLGELLVETRESGARDPGGRGRIESRPTIQLADLGITPDQSSKWQKIATIPEPEFESLISRANATGEELTTAKVLRQVETARRKATPAPEPEVKELVRRWLRAARKFPDANRLGQLYLSLWAAEDRGEDVTGYRQELGFASRTLGELMIRLAAEIEMGGCREMSGIFTRSIPTFSTLDGLKDGYAARAIREYYERMLRSADAA